MKTVVYTQRVEIVKSYGERRDCADQNIPYFIQRCGYLPVPMPNIWNVAKEILMSIKPSGIILTGGNSLVKYGGDAPERDDIEKKLLDFALENDIPLYGFCRGMQVIIDYFGFKLDEIEGHVAVRHKLLGEEEGLEVNSFHNQACCAVKEPLKVLAYTEDGVIEEVLYKKKRILGTMWHPERENPISNGDIHRVRNLFG